jgi:hypothetical protein
MQATKTDVRTEEFMLAYLDMRSSGSTGSMARGQSSGQIRPITSPSGTAKTNTWDTTSLSSTLTLT